MLRISGFQRMVVTARILNHSLYGNSLLPQQPFYVMEHKFLRSKQGMLFSDYVRPTLCNCLFTRTKKNIHANGM